jgi:hypothetical protein
MAATRARSRILAQTANDWKEGGDTVRTYERPTLTLAGSFKKITGLGGFGPRDILMKQQQL